MLTRHRYSNLRAVIRPLIFSLSAALLPVACGGDKELIAPLTVRVTGKVTSSVTGNPVSGAEVRIGAATFTTGSTGLFGLGGLAPGAVTIRCKAAGFVDFETVITVTSGIVNQDVGLTRTNVGPKRAEVYEFGNFALYMDAGVDITQGIIVALGGPDTRGFATGKPLGAPIPAVEASLQALGQEFRTLASIYGVAILGTSRAAMTNGLESDKLLLDAIDTAAARSSRPGLAGIPLLLYGLSGGGPEASGFTARNPERVAGLFLKVPSGVSSVTSGAAVRVPTYMVQAELDAFVDNSPITAAFEGNRAAGALWALAKEAGVAHHSLTPVQRDVTINWISTVLELRVTESSWWDGLVGIAENSGWLGNRATGNVAPWATYPGDRSLASWLPSEITARNWERLVAASGN